MKVIDSHTEGEPTRVIIDGGPYLGQGTLGERLFRFQHHSDEYRRFAIDEPRGWDAIVGALLCQPDDPSCVAGVIFFNNTGYLGMCGHGTIGVAVTLFYLGRIGMGIHRIQTPVGTVSVNLLSSNQVSFENVSSYRYRRDVIVEVAGIGKITGDIVWGGNWFFLAHGSPLPLVMENLEELLRLSKKIKASLALQRITGANDAAVDHIEFSEDRAMESCDSRNFVLCPGGVYDRSPCGTGTSAKLACLAGDGKLAPGQRWVQESITGGRFVGAYRHDETLRDGCNAVIATITGNAYICGETKLISQANDRFGFGITRKDRA